ncbi:hypothetical protein IGI04_001081 [Brassica rapa subsp. trilocularis]|uniref:Replication factor A C-terminal domain-containing protein n=1 Tax=Brassica rapa subsp. trilocularis TaxID=1813537 RepID=A0ABQ7NRR9_BRACM|nr:hypothetical protein IGI04_001081 [Brassica rapa subsp. trilocularis]
MHLLGLQVERPLFLHRSISLLRFWEAMNIRRGGDLMGVDMLLIDCQVIYLTPILVHRLSNIAGDHDAGNPKMVGGNQPIKTYKISETSAGESFFNRLVEEDTGVTPATPLLRGYAKVEALSIAELCHHSLSGMQPERVTEIKIDKWWCYVSCSNCGKKLQHTASSFTCVPCNNTSVVGVLRVVCLLRWVMTKLHNMRAYEDGHLLSILCVDYLFIQSHSSNLAQAGDGVNPEETEAPPFVKDMEGKTYKLQGGDSGDNNHGGNSVPVKVEAAGSTNVDGATGKVKKARKA